MLAPQAKAEVLAVFADQAGTNCNIVAPLNQFTTCYLVLLESTVESVAAIELGIRGLPREWNGWIDVCPPCGVVLPSGFGDGTSLGLLECARGQPLVVAPVILFPMGEPDDVVLEVGAKIPPRDADFDCPIVIQCDAPVFTAVCVQGGRSFVNSSTPCTVSVASSSWGAVKSLYRQ
jgi:hypothetical protein